MMEFLAESNLQSEGEKLWRWIKRHPVLAVGALLVVTLAFAPSQPQGHASRDPGLDEPPLFI